MIISHRHRFVFVHCRKTAGSSIAAYLNPYLGWRDIQVGAWHDSFEVGGRATGRFVLDVARSLTREPSLLRDVLAVISCGRSDDDSLARKLNKIQKRNYAFSNPPHPRADEIRSFDPVAWEEYFKFCFVRNPYEKAVSDYIWRVTSRGKNVGFLEFLRRVADPELPDPEAVVPRNPVSWPMYTIDGRIAVDFVGRYENLNPDLRTICDRIGIPFDPERLPRAKKKKGYDYRDYFGPQERTLVQEIYREELEHFGYGFERVCCKETSMTTSHEVLRVHRR